jgi:hypothetical protein
MELHADSSHQFLLFLKEIRLTAKFFIKVAENHRTICTIIQMVIAFRGLGAFNKSGGYVCLA